MADRGDMVSRNSTGGPDRPSGNPAGKELARTAADGLSAAPDEIEKRVADALEREMAKQQELVRLERLTTMGALTASIAHEINQPLAAIVANGNAAQRWLANTHPDLDEARTALKNIVRDGYRASQIISSVRAMLERDSRDSRPLSINTIIGDILALVHIEIARHRVTVRTELNPDLPDVMADRTQLQQVFLHLIVNAVEAMNTVQDRERILIVTSDMDETAAVNITVEDTGSGINSTDADRIFDPLFTTKTDGTGMGLPICRTIVESCGGRLWATPGTPHGSVFHIVWPVNGS
jgi:signal transduction histidine kinase